MSINFTKRCRLIFNIPLQLRDEFKAACAMRGTEMGNEVRKFVNAYVSADKVILDRLKEKYEVAKYGE